MKSDQILVKAHHSIPVSNCEELLRIVDESMRNLGERLLGVKTLRKLSCHFQFEIIYNPLLRLMIHGVGWPGAIGGEDENT